MKVKAVWMAILFISLGLFLIWYAGIDLSQRNYGNVYCVTSVVVLSLMGAQFWND